jgi:hypothetical protein
MRLCGVLRTCEGRMSVADRFHITVAQWRVLVYLSTDLSACARSRTGCTCRRTRFARTSSRCPGFWRRGPHGLARRRPRGRLCDDGGEHAPEEPRHTLCARRGRRCCASRGLIRRTCVCVALTSPGCWFGDVGDRDHQERADPYGASAQAAPNGSGAASSGRDSAPKRRYTLLSTTIFIVAYNEGQSEMGDVNVPPRIC